MILKGVVLPGPRHLDGVDVEAADGEGGPDGGHQGPGVHPGVTQVYHQVVVQTLGRYCRYCRYY